MLSSSATWAFHSSLKRWMGKREGWRDRNWRHMRHQHAIWNDFPLKNFRPRPLKGFSPSKSRPKTKSNKSLSLKKKTFFSFENLQQKSVNFLMSHSRNKWAWKLLRTFFSSLHNASRTKRMNAVNCRPNVFLFQLISRKIHVHQFKSSFEREVSLF